MNYSHREYLLSIPSARYYALNRAGSATKFKLIDNISPQFLAGYYKSQERISSQCCILTTYNINSIR